MASENYRQLVERVFGVALVRTDLWTASYEPAVATTAIAQFPLGGLLPAIMYLARWGHRRGNGKFVETYKPINPVGEQLGDKDVTAGDVAARLCASEEVSGEGEASEAILADLLIGHCFDTKNRASRRDSPILRAYPVHYLSSWLDLPGNFSHLRGVPEMLTALLANQADGDSVGPSGKRGPFGVGGGFEDNLLLKILGPAMTIEGLASSLTTSDQFRDAAASDLSIEQLLMIRVALLMAEAPQQAKGSNPLIPNQHPLAEGQAQVFRDDLRIFLEAYGSSMPWQSFVTMMEVGIALGLTTTFLATARMLFYWEGHQGILPEEDEPWPIFVDASAGADRRIRQPAEESLGGAYRAMEHLPVVMSALRALAAYTSRNSRVKNDLPKARPSGKAHINFLGDIQYGRHPRATAVNDALDQKCFELAEELERAEAAADVSELLRSETISPASRLGEAIVRLMGRVSQEAQYVKFLTSCLIGDEGDPNSFLHRRSGQRNNRKFEARSLVLTNAALDYLVHRHLRKNGSHRRGRLTLLEFIDTLRDSYGWYIDQEPPGMTVPTEVLLRNRQFLERRLRDLGLLIGVNDAESMKYLESRLEAHA